MNDTAPDAVSPTVNGTAMKRLTLDTSIYDLTEKYPELIEILKEMGFFGVSRPAVRNTLGKVTTLAQGCERQGKDLVEVKSTLEEHGFTVKTEA